MCTLVALHRCVPGVRLWIAANRDEYLDRPAEGPAVRAGDARPFVAPLDRRAGGTWWGLNAAGLFAAVTNRPTAHLDPQRRSRGVLVPAALSHASALAAATEAAALGPDLFNPFNFFAADGREAYAVVYEGRPRLVPLAPGPHVIGNADPDTADVPKVRETLARAAAAAQGSPAAIEDSLAALCRQHAPDADPRSATCVHLERYGTRSSTLLRLGGTGDRLLHAEGPPCTTAYRDLTPLLAHLAHAGRPTAGETATRKAS
jgi:uncharacterized protein with NRDE domain